MSPTCPIITLEERAIRVFHAVTRPALRVFPTTGLVLLALAGCQGETNDKGVADKGIADGGNA